MTNRLQWEVFVSAQIPVVTSDLPPGASEMKWSPISSTLISGKRDAVLVDTAITIDQNQKIVDWIVESGKNLTAIYATHGHGDHFFGVNTIQKKFPKARFVATREAIAVMRKQASVPVVDSYWKPRFPGQIDSTLVIADELKGGVLELEGEQLIGIPLATPIPIAQPVSTSLRSDWPFAAMRSTTMFIFIWVSRMPKAARSGSRRSIRSSRLRRWPLLPDTRGPAHPIRQITSRRHENTFVISKGLLPIPRPCSIYTTRCLRFIPNA
jgi:Zn-dependent hydrolases, including glyoxylases